MHAAGCSVVGVEGPHRPWGSMELPVSIGATEVFKAENCSSDLQFFQKSLSTVQRWKERRQDCKPRPRGGLLYKFWLRG